MHIASVMIDARFQGAPRVRPIPSHSLTANRPRSRVMSLLSDAPPVASTRGPSAPLSGANTQEDVLSMLAAPNADAKTRRAELALVGFAGPTYVHAEGAASTGSPDSLQGGLAQVARARPSHRTTLLDDR
jgi:hypothetical protein